MDITLTKLPNGVLAPATPDDAELLKKIKAGQGVRVQLTQIRNYPFHKKWFALANYAFEMWSELGPPIMHKGERVKPNFERFRKDLVIMAGYYDVVFNIKNELRMEAKSISFGKMKQDEFDKLYSATIDAILTKILSGTGLTEEKLRHYVDNVMAFD